MKECKKCKIKYADNIMFCQNCGKNEVNFRYTQIVNGVKNFLTNTS